MNKRGLETITLELILGVLVLVVLVGFVTLYRDVAEAQASRDVVRLWVLESGKKQEVAKFNIQEIGRPSVAIVNPEPLLISTKKQLERDAHGLIANEMVDCWNTFVRGEVNFLGKWAEENVFCFPCATVSFAEELKNDPKAKLSGFNKFLAERRPDGNQPTYKEILTKKNEKLKELTPRAEADVVPVSEDLYVFFVATSGKQWRFLLKSAEEGIVSAAKGDVGGVAGGLGGALIGAKIGGVAGTIIPGVGNVAGAIIGGVAGGLGGVSLIEAVFSEDVQFEPLVILGPADFITKHCNPE